MNINELNNHEFNQSQIFKAKTLNNKRINKSSSMVNFNKVTKNIENQNQTQSFNFNKFSSGKSVIRACCQNKMAISENKSHLMRNYQYKKNKINYKYGDCTPEEFSILEKVNQF